MNKKVSGWSREERGLEAKVKRRRGEKMKKNDLRETVKRENWDEGKLEVEKKWRKMNK